MAGFETAPGAFRNIVRVQPGQYLKESRPVRAGPFKEFGGYRSRRDTCHGDAKAVHFLMQCIRERAHETLACVIQSHVRPGNEARYGSEIDDAATSARYHSR